MRLKCPRSRSAPPKPRQGAILIEVLVAVAMLGIGALSVFELAIESTRSVHLAEIAEAELARANGLLTAIALWSPSDLDRHLGTRREGPWRLEIERRVPALYSVVLMDSSGQRVVLTTTLYRPESGKSAQR